MIMAAGIDPQTVPINRPLKRYEIEAYVAAVIRQDHEEYSGFQPPLLAQVGNLGERLGLKSDALSQFNQANKSIPYLRCYNEFIHSLMSLGALIRNWNQPQGNFYKLSERGEELLADVSKLGDETMRIFLETLRDEELRSRCQDNFFRTKAMDTLIRDACVVLEDRLRKKIGAKVDVYGMALVNQSLRPNEGTLIVSEINAEQEGAHRLFLGAVQFFGNPTHHRLLTDLPAVRARETIGFIDLLLQILAESKLRQ